MSTVLSSLLILAAVPVVLAGTYLLALTLLWRRPRAAAAPPSIAESASASASALSCCVLVPAHNEASGIAATLASLMQVDYPRDRFRVVVVADNCTDDTAAIAAQCGAAVLTRTDTSRRGKGWALRFAIDHLLAEAAASWDVLLVVDADSRVSPNLLTAVTARVAAGARAVQATYLPAPSAPGPTSVITDVAFTAFHCIRSAGRERLGLSTGLRGNGMAFTRDLLRQVPHGAFSRTEDLEFGVLLGLRGVRVAYADDAVVQGEMPTRPDVVAGQRERWIGGRAEMARRFVPGLATAAWRTRSLMLADLACDLLMPPLSAVVLAAFAGLGVSAMAALLFETGAVAIWLWATACAALAIHVAVAAHVAGRTGDLVRAAWAIPRYAWLKTAITTRAAWRSGEANTSWIRTAREGELQ